jgi:hypothetical protein
MATSPTSQSAPLSGAAKDDTLVASTNFTIADLLANDPGGAAKVNTDTQFFFGTAEDQDDQAAYMAAHGIIDNGDGTYTLTGNASDFQYMVQIGNKGTWSLADVDVAPGEPVVDPHLGDNLFTENFDGYGADTQQTYYDPPGTAVFAAVDLNAANDWTGASSSELGADGYGDIETTTGIGEEAFWLDTQNSPGGINITHEFTDTTDAVDGVTSVLSFDVAIQSLDYLGNHYETDPDATLEVQIDGVAVATIGYDDFAIVNEMNHYEIPIAAYADLGDDTHTISIVDTSPDASYTGFAVDSIAINDWVA